MPYQETIRGSAKAHGRHKKQTGGRGQFGDCHIEIEPLPDGDFEFVNAIKGGVIPTGFIPAVEKGVREAMEQGVVAGYPVKGVRVKLFDGSYHTVDSSEMAFKLAGSIAMKQALEQASPVLLEPIMLVTARVPDETRRRRDGRPVARRGRPLGTEAVGGMTEVKAEVPMSGDAHLRARPALDHRRPGRVHDGVPALRGDPGAPRAEGRDEAREEEEAVAREPSGRGRCGRHSGRRPTCATLAVAPRRGPSRDDIKTNQQDVACDVCGRTLLRGEHAEPFLAGGERRQVCELCTARAQHEGWIRESGADELTLRQPRDEGAPLAHRPPAPAARARARGPTRSRPEEAAGDRRRLPPRARRDRARARSPPPEPPRAPAPRPRGADQRRAQDGARARRLQRLRPPRTVGGVARSLGAPEVCVRPLPERPSVVTITVMWELSWYRFEVDLSDEARRRAARGPGRRARPSSSRRSRSSTPPPTSAAACTSLRRGRRELDG